MIIALSCDEGIIQPDSVLSDQSTNANLKAAVVGTTYYVEKSGNDNNSGTISAPFQTIQKAANVVKPGDTVIVGDGSYTSSGETIVTLSRSGTDGSPITFKSKNKFGAVFDGRDNATDNGFVFNNVSYVNLRDFEFEGFAFWTIHARVGSHHLEITGNHIHDIGRLCTSTTYGLVGCYLEQVSDVVFSRNILHDIGRYANGENGCSNSNTNYKNHDHGLYLNGVTNVVANNNLFYNIKGQSVHIYSYNNKSSSNVKIVNNTFAFGNKYYVAGHIMMWGSLSNAVIANNIFYSQFGSGLQVYQGSFTYSNVVIKNNVTYLGNGMVNSGTASGVSIFNNFNKTDPKMVNPNAFNFKLQSSSPDINAGVGLGLLTDYSDNSIVGLPDIGAFEY